MKPVQSSDASNNTAVPKAAHNLAQSLLRKVINSSEHNSRSVRSDPDANKTASSFSSGSTQDSGVKK